MPDRLRRVFLTGIALLSFGGGYLAAVIVGFLSDKEGREPVALEPARVVAAPDGVREAVLFWGRADEPWNLIGTDERAYLGIRSGNSTVLVLEDLFEGHGTYESGILGIAWRGDNVAIKRVLKDARSDLSFDSEKMRWEGREPGDTSQR